MTNSRAYFYRGPFEKGLSKENLKLKRAIMAFGNGKKIVDSLNEMPE